MGAATRRRGVKRQELLDQLLKQTDPEVVQIPLQIDDGWFRGIQGNWVKEVLELWAPHKGDRQLWVYRVDKFWVCQSWKTKGGSLIPRGDLLVEVSVNSLAKELWYNTVTQPQFVELFKEHLESFKRGENGCVQFWWLQRFLLCHSLNQPKPINYWEYYPAVEVYHPDGSKEDQMIDTTDFLDNSNKTLEQDPKAIESASELEKKVFQQCIKYEEVS